MQPLTPRQVHQAVRAAHWAAAYFKAEPATGATAIPTTTALDAAGFEHGQPEDVTASRILSLVDPDGNRIVVSGPFSDA